MVMEYFEGQNLKTVLRRGPLPIEEATEYLLQICDALTEVHTAGIVHRDVKPANLLLTMRPGGTLCIKLLDFGIAKFMGADNPSEVEEVDLTCDSMIGSLRYMSPEHVASTKSVDWRTDLWSLGVTGYELLTTKTPFGGVTRMDIMSNILDKQKKPESLRVLRPELSPVIEGVILRCLEKDRNERFQSAVEVARALREAMGIVGPAITSSRMEMPSTTTAIALSVTDEPDRHHESRMTTLPLRKHTSRLKTVLVIGGAAFVVPTMLVFGAALQGPTEPSTGAPTEQMTPSAIVEQPTPQIDEPAMIDAGIDSSLTETPESPDAALSVIFPTDTVTPLLVKPQQVESKQVKPQPVESKPAKPQPAKPQPAKPQPAKSAASDAKKVDPPPPKRETYD
jgi:hypothetical protein